ncbi:hypothetical protein [Streptomyces aureus]|uniref:hypothetical protein n=1 Tax=Streptomyces aureus TaxID=193461 RepID=UPI00055E751E|nr:hypothetical protein [Streptomyces aureus]
MTDPSLYLPRIQQAWANADDAADRFAANGMPSDRLRNIIEGKQRPNTLDMALIAEACQVSVDWLLYGTEPRPARIPDHTVNEEQPADDEPAAAPPTDLLTAAADAIRSAVCTGDGCEDTEDDCARKRVQPCVWEHGVLTEVLGTPEVLAAAALSVLPAADPART